MFIVYFPRQGIHREFTKSMFLPRKVTSSNTEKLGVCTWAVVGYCYNLLAFVTDFELRDISVM